MAPNIEVGATIAGLSALQERLNRAVHDITEDAARIIRANVSKAAPVGVPGNSTNPPGDLARSIDITGPHGGAWYYEAQVGPTVVYGRQRELGGDIYPKVARSLVFTKFGKTVYTSHVYQKPNPYTLRGEMDSVAEVEVAARVRVAEAIIGR